MKAYQQKDDPDDGSVTGAVGVDLREGFRSVKSVGKRTLLTNEGSDQRLGATLECSPAFCISPEASEVFHERHLR